MQLNPDERTISVAGLHRMSNRDTSGGVGIKARWSTLAEVMENPMNGRINFAF